MRRGVREALPTDLGTLSSVERWRLIANAIRETDPKLGAFLDHAEVLAIDAERIHLRIERGSFFHNEVTSNDTKRRITEVASRILGGAPEIEFEAPLIDSERSDLAGETVFRKDKEAREQREREEIERARSHPVVLEAVRVLGARVKNIELPKNDV